MCESVQVVARFETRSGIGDYFEDGTDQEIQTEERLQYSKRITFI
jgi:hypothetical protein